MTKPLDGLSEHQIKATNGDFSEVGHVRMRTLEDLVRDRISEAYATISREREVIDCLQRVLTLTKEGA